MKETDCLIVGIGPAGLTAALYAQRYALKTIVIGKSLGQAGDAIWIENFPAIKSISGSEFIQKMMEQVTSLGAEIIFDEILEIKKSGKYFTAKTSSEEFKAKSVILAMGSRQKKLEVQGEKELIGKGVAYCASCEGAFYKNKIAGVVGGGNSALTAALMLAQHAEKVYLFHRSEFRAEPVWIEKVKKDSKIEIHLNSVIEKINGKSKVESVLIKENNKSKEIKLDGLFIEVGHIPNTELAEKLGVKLNEKKLIEAGKNMNTNIKGVFAAGDATGASELKQIVVSAGQGAIAAFSVFNYLKSEFNE
ncbi:MAG: FAD-dependent oxidoreductase [Candidatus Diapherotrites archaeon]|nr:FAD-dependent oxidoreductase [Candidatus Diapherotrites archaeon]